MRKYLIKKLNELRELFISSRLIRNYKLKKERQKLFERKDYLLANGFPVIFDGRDKIQERIIEITKELSGY